MSGYDKVNRLTLKRGSWQWVNSDLPDIITPTGDILIECSFPDYKIYVSQNVMDDMGLTIEDVTKFVENSDKAFHHHFRKYEWAGDYEQGHLTKRIEVV